MRLLSALLIAAASLGFTACGSSDSSTTSVARAKTTKLGVAGRTIIDGSRMKTTVESLNPETRTLTVIKEDGTTAVLVAGPEVYKFPDFKPGDPIYLTVVEQVTIKVMPEGMTAEQAAAGIDAPRIPPSKPGFKNLSAAARVATVTALDIKKHRATLRFEDGTVETHKVRTDVPLEADGVGHRVLFHKSVVLFLEVFY